MASVERELRLRLPGWVPDFLEASPERCVSVEERMRLAIDLARANIAHATGGPFGAAVFERDTGRLLSVGVNVVVTQHCSAAHAEILALSLAQASAGRYSLASPDGPAAQLVSSAEPCAMCMAALPWSGIAELVAGARDSDCREVGFDEGHKPEEWARRLEERGIRVLRDVLRDEASEVLRDYRSASGTIYNG